MKYIELLAPAKNADIGIAAIDCGADAVYIAGPRFGARQAAGNEMADIKRLCDYAGRFGARVFVALNTILFDNEIDDARKQMLEIEEAGADAIIVQDMAVVSLAAELRQLNGFALPLHASTQCAIRTPEQAVFLERLGFSRLILERELSLEQIKAIRKAVSCEIEVFVHGALCVCYSGQCYLSEMIAGRSANRGACIQACRSRYDLIDADGRTIVKDKALLSLKDLNLKARLSDLAEAGVTSFKIEGRLKNASYVKNVVREYSEEVDRIVSKSAGTMRRTSFGKVSEGFAPDPSKTFNRGYTDLFIDGRRGRWASMDAAKSMGEEVGVVTRIRDDYRCFEISPSIASASGPNKVGAAMKSGPSLSPASDAKNKATSIDERVLHNGDGLTFVAESGDIVGFRADVCSGNVVRCKRVPQLYKGAVIFRNLNTAFEKEMEAHPCKRVIPVSISVSIEKVDGSSITTKDDGSFLLSKDCGNSSTAKRGDCSSYIVVASAVCEDGRKVELAFDAGKDKAENKERMKSLFVNQLSKTTEHYAFSLDSIEPLRGDDGGEELPFLSMAALNVMRRSLAAALGSRACGRIPLPRLLPWPAEGVAQAAPHDIDYKANVSNHVSRDLYNRIGCAVKGLAYEVEHPDKAELMRTKYCIRHELGICPKQKSSSDSTLKGLTCNNRPLFLLNNGRRLALHFDCANCEMTVTQA